MKATEQYFPVVLFIILFKVILTFESVDEILKCDHSKVKTTEQYFPVMLFVSLQSCILHSKNLLCFKPESSLGHRKVKK